MLINGKNDIVKIHGEYEERQVNLMSEDKILKTLVNRFDQLDSKFEQIDQRFDSIDSKLNEHDHKFEKIDQRFDSVESKLEEQDQRFEQIDKRFDSVESKLEEHDDKLDKLGNISEERSIELYNIKSILKKHDSKFDKMQQTITKIHNQTVRLSLNQSEMNMKIDKLINSSSGKKDENIDNI